MHGPPRHHQPDSAPHDSHPQRWRILGVLVVALLVTSIDHTIINVALPRLVTDLGTSSAGLQWVVAAYTIVFAGLLLTAGNLGDRHGRRHALLLGLTAFLAGSTAAALATSTTMLVVARGIMGLGGAFIMPTTLSILVQVFGDPRERAKAIGVWTAVSGLGIALGPICGGALMRSFSWSSVFWINVPLLVVALVGAIHLVPDSRDPHPAKLDLLGAVLSTTAVGLLVYGTIEAPEHGWGSSSTLLWFAAGAVALAAFLGWESRRDEPMLDLRLFRQRAFTAGSVTLAVLFFAMAGAVFLQAQYLQIVLGYTPLAAGVALVPAALGMLFGTGAGAHADTHLSDRATVTTGAILAALGIIEQAAFVDGSSYWPTGVGLFLFGLGVGIAMPAATNLIMVSVPAARAGVGSAVNDTVREVGGALGVAVIGSIAASSYAADMGAKLDGITAVPTDLRAALTDNVGAAIEASHRLGSIGGDVAEAARSAFVDSMSGSLWIAGAIASLAAIAAVAALPKASSDHQGHHAHHHGGTVHAAPEPDAGHRHLHDASV